MPSLAHMKVHTQYFECVNPTLVINIQRETPKQDIYYAMIANYILYMFYVYHLMEEVDSYLVCDIVY